MLGPGKPLALLAAVRAHVLKLARYPREVYLLARLKARSAKIHLWLLREDYHYRLTQAAALIALPVRRPFLFLANLFAELAVLFQRCILFLDRLHLLLVKAEGYFLKRENARLEVSDES